VRRALLPVVLFGVALAASACGSSESPPKPEPKPLTMRQAELLAGAQFLNYRNDGTEFEMDFGVKGTPSHFTMTGQMNWDDLVGYGTITPDEGEPFEVWWREDIVIQSDPQLAALLQAADQQPVYVAHKPNPQANPVDKACAIMLHLGSKQRDNPLLVRQAKGSAYLGDATIGAKANIGAGTIFANYDGKKKHKSVVGAGAFIGSGTVVVAPNSIPEGATTGAGAVVAKNAPIGPGETWVGLPAKKHEKRAKGGG